MTPTQGRRRLGIVALLLAVALFGGALPAHASIGGSADALGMRARAPEVRLEVTATGAVSMVQPILDRLTRDPIVAGQHELASEVGTPEAPSGTESQTTARRTIPGVIDVAEITARTERIYDAELSAQAHVGGVDVTILGLEVLTVGEVHASVSTHPVEDPTAQASAPHVRVFSQQVTLPADDPVDIDESLSTAEVLAALEQAIPGLRGIVEAVGGAFEANGGFQVRIGRSAEADLTTGSASATGFYADVDLNLHVRVCIPRPGGGCLAELTISTDAQVLDLVLAQASVERPEPIPVVERIDWALVVPLIAGVALVLFVLGLVLGRMRGRGQPAAQAPEPTSRSRYG